MILLQQSSSISVMCQKRHIIRLSVKAHDSTLASEGGTSQIGQHHFDLREKNQVHPNNQSGKSNLLNNE